MKKDNKKINKLTFDNLTRFVKKNYLTILLIALFITHLFFRFYQINERFIFGWDQLDNAWTAKDIIDLHKYPLVGMVAKGNSGFNIGPAYYYLVAFFYYLSNLHPIGSAYIAGVTSIITFFSLYYVIKKIFNEKIALIAIFIHTFSFFVISGDRIQWPVNFIAPISALIFYALYQILQNKPKYIIILALLVGLSFHVHFTSVFYPIIIFLTLPLWRWNKETIKYVLIAIPVFAIWLIPNYIANIKSNNQSTSNLSSYIGTYYHGLHLIRVLQLAHDALIEFGLIIRIDQIAFLKYFLIPIFAFVYLHKNITKKNLQLVYLILLWIAIPWLVFSVYSGEISNYYFFITRPVILMTVAYLIYRLITQKYLIVKLLVIVLGIYFTYFNSRDFLNEKGTNISSYENEAIRAVKAGEDVQYAPGDPNPFFFYVYKTRHNK